MKIAFEKMNGLVPAVIQDALTDKVLMVGYMNEEALAVTRSSNRVTFFSRSKGRLWVKGETSGNFLTVRSIREDCDGDALLIKAIPSGPVCHEGTDTCFNERNRFSVEQLEEIIQERRKSSENSSYVATLFRKGTAALAQKVGEEAVELVIEALGNSDDRFKNEAADLLFHLLLLLQNRNLLLSDIVEVLETRHEQKKGLDKETLSKK